MFQIKVVEKIITHILCSVTSFSKILPFLDNFKKYDGVREAAKNMTLSRCMLCT